MTQHPSLLGMNHLIGENIQKHIINLYHIDILKLRKSSLPPFPPFSLPHLKNSQSNINFTIVGQHSVHTFVSANHLIIAFFNPSEYLNIFYIHHSKHLKCCNTVLLNEFQKKKLMMTFRAGGVNHISFLCFALQCTIRNVQHFTTPVFMCSLNILFYHVFVVVTLVVCIRLLKILLTKVHNTYN